MPKYKYLVINPENKQLNGTIGAPDEQNARRELNELGFSVISIEEIPEEQVIAPISEIPVFEFGALDKNGKRVIGTIQAEDRYSAYKRLLSEYSFNVDYVIDNKLSEPEKEKERKKGALDLQDRIAEEQMAAQKQASNEEKDMKEFALQQEVLNTQINFVLNKVKNILDKYEATMKPETKAKIRYFVDKLFRIRSSTNLDYIRKTAEELLTYIQKEELFLQEESMVKEKTKLLVEAKGMMLQLRQSRSKKAISITDQLRSWQDELGQKKENINIIEKIGKYFISLLIGSHLENPDIIQAKKEIAITNDQIIQYFRLYFDAPTPEFKKETKESIKRLFKERKTLKNKLKQLKHALKKEKLAAGEETGMTRFCKELLTFTGWMLLFYLIYYFCSIYLTTKQTGVNDIPFVFYIYKSAFLKYFLATIFLLHSSVSIKINFFKNNTVASLVITPTFLLSLLLIFLNL
ncbi:MAG TPA: hypothetical protein P5229_02100 [Candidatus Gracilibacteria bacterium]|nr:hypothetical protein [Candidatus Gracilibacteria bacterium]